MYDLLNHSPELKALMLDVPPMADRIVPRESQNTVNLSKPFIIYGLGNNTNEDLSEDEDHEAHRQFFQIWIHDEPGSYIRIDDAIRIIKALFNGRSHPPSHVLTVRWLENSAEFSNQTYNTIFRYMRFQAIIAKGVPVT